VDAVGAVLRPDQFLTRPRIPLPPMLTERRTSVGVGQRVGAAEEVDVAGVAAARRRQRFPLPLRRRKVR
jgi:hypothetical protein